jgi:hypothetical protein
MQSLTVDAHSNLKLALIRAFLAEYRSTVLALAFLCALSVYAIQMQRLFEFLMLVVMELQLELAYRQWWLEAKGREARLVVARVLPGKEENTLELFVENVGRDFACDVNIPFLILSLDMYAKLSALFSLRPALIKHFIKLLRSCAECEGGTLYEATFMEPGWRGSLSVDLFDCIKNQLHHVVIFIGVCREALPKLFSQCDAYVVVFLNERFMYTRYNVEREPPGIFTRIPNMISDLMLMLRISKARH